MTAKTYGQRPSTLIALDDPWLALQFDQATALVGLAIENALSEQERIGPKDKPEWRPKYTLGQLLAESFRLPAEIESRAAEGSREAPKGGLSTLLALAGRLKGGIRVVKES